MTKNDKYIIDLCQLSVDAGNKLAGGMSKKK